MRAVSAHKSYEWNNDFRNFSFRKTGFILVIIISILYSLSFQPWGLMDTQLKLYYYWPATVKSPRVIFPS